MGFTDRKDLKNCREVSKSWQKSIDNKNFAWLQIVNIPSFLEKGNTYLHVAAKTGLSEIFEIIFEFEAEKNPNNYDKETPFHFACRYDHFKIAKFLLQKYALSQIDFNAKDDVGLTPYQYAKKK